MKIYITGLPSGYEVEHLVRLFYPMAPLTLTPPENAEDCVWAEKTPDGLHALVRQDGRSAERHAPLPAPVEQGGETPEFSLASLTYDLLRDWTGIRPPWGKMTGVRPVRLIHDKRAAGWTEAEIDHFFLDRFDCSQQKYQMAKAIADLQEPILKVGNEPGTYSLYIGIPFCPSRCSYCSFVSCNLDRDRKMVQPYVDCLCKEVEEIRIQADKAGLKLCSIYIGGGTPTSLSADQHKSATFVEFGLKGEVSITTAPLTPKHDLREVRGSYMELTDRRNYDGTAVDDYLHITLTDEQDVPDALARLRVIYPNLMRLDYDNLRTREDQEITAPERAESITPLEHFSAFYQLQNNQPLTAEQAAFCQQLIEEIWKEGEDA